MCLRPRALPESHEQAVLEDAKKGDSFCIPPKNYCNLIDQKASGDEVEELLLHEFRASGRLRRWSKGISIELLATSLLVTTATGPQGAWRRWW